MLNYLLCNLTWVQSHAAGCNKLSSPRQILSNWIRCVIAVLWLSKVYGHNPIHLRKSQLQLAATTSYRQDKFFQINWIRCVIAVFGSRKFIGTIPFTLKNHSTAGCNKFSSPRQILPNWIRCVKAVLWPSKVYGHNSIHLRKSQYSWLQ